MNRQDAVCVCRLPSVLEAHPQSSFNFQWLTDLDTPRKRLGLGPVKANRHQVIFVFRLAHQHHEAAFGDAAIGLEDARGLKKHRGNKAREFHHVANVCHANLAHRECFVVGFRMVYWLRANRIAGGALPQGPLPGLARWHVHDRGPLKRQNLQHHNRLGTLTRGVNSPDHFEVVALANRPGHRVTLLHHKANHLIQIVGLLDEAASRRDASRRTGHPGCVQHSASVLI